MTLGFVEDRRDAIDASDDPIAREADVRLAGACALGDRDALQQVRTLLDQLLGPLLGRMGVTAADRDEVTQRIEVALFVASAERPAGIEGYRGRGPLSAYLRAVAATHALKYQQRRGPEQPTELDVLARSPLVGSGSGNALERADASATFKAAFAVALAALEPRDRTLLRQHYVDNVSAEQLAGLHKVHRATTTRWLESARVELLRQLRRELASQGVAVDEIESMVGMIESRIDLSLSRLLPA